MEREERGGIGMGNTCKPLAVSFQCMTKSTTNKKKRKKNKKHLLLGRKAMTNLHSILKSRNITLPTKVCQRQSYGFSSSHIWMRELD